MYVCIHIYVYKYVYICIYVNYFFFPSSAPQIFMSFYYMCLHTTMCPHTTIYLHRCRRCDFLKKKLKKKCVLTLLYMCIDAADAPCVQLSSDCLDYICVRILLFIRPRTTIYASSYTEHRDGHTNASKTRMYACVRAILCVCVCVCVCVCIMHALFFFNFFFYIGYLGQPFSCACSSPQP